MGYGGQKEARLRDVYEDDSLMSEGVENMRPMINPIASMNIDSFHGRDSFGSFSLESMADRRQEATRGNMKYEHFRFVGLNAACCLLLSFVQKKACWA